MPADNRFQTIVWAEMQISQRLKIDQSTLSPFLIPCKNFKADQNLSVAQTFLNFLGQEIHNINIDASCPGKGLAN